MEMAGLAALDLQWNCDGNGLGLGRMSRAGDQIPGLAALDLKIKSAMDLAGLAALDLHCICDSFDAPDSIRHLM